MKRIIKFSVLVLAFLCIASNNAHGQTQRFKYVSYIFPSDSIRGFDEASANQDALARGFFGKEYKYFMYRAKRDFVNKKYGYSQPTFDASALNTSGFKPGNPIINNAPCVNEDFEASTSTTSTSSVGSVGTSLTGWTVSTGNNTNSCTMAGCCSSSGSSMAWIRATPWTCPAPLNLIPNSPLGGTNVLQMNDNIPGTNMVRIAQTFPVTPTNALFQMAYMAALNGSGHACCDQPFIKITMLDCSNNPLACPSISITPPGSACVGGTTGPGWVINTSGVSYTSTWQIASVDLTPYLGSCVTIQITVSDCDGGAHEGWAFVDCACKAMTIGVNSLLFPAGTSAVAITACSLGTASITAPPGLGPYLWNGPAGSGVTSNTNQVINTSTSGQYTLTMTPPGACAPITKTVTLTFATTPTAGFTTTNVCSSYTITNTGTGAPAVQTYSFAGAGAPASYTTTNPTSTVTFPTAGTYTIYQTVTNSGSCTATASAVVNAPVSPNVAFTTPSYTQCLTGNSFVFTAALSTGIHTYSFAPAAGAPAPGATATYGPVNFTAAGTYTVTHTINSAGCTNITTSVVVINPQPTPVANNNGPICTGSNLLLTTSAGNTYNWNGPGGYTSAVQNPTIVAAGVAQSGVYSVTVTAVGGCSAVAVTNVAVVTPTATPANTGPYCAGQTISLSTNAAGSYTWTGPGFLSNLQNPTIPASTTLMSGVYTVTLTFGTCTASGTTNVVVNPSPNPVIGSNSPVCVGNTINFTGNGGTSYQWNGPGGFSSTNQNPTIPVATMASNGIFTLTATGPGGCTSFTTQTYVVNAQPIVQATGSNVCGGGNAPLTANGGTSYSWTGPNGFVSASQNPTVFNLTPSGVGQYTVLVTDANSCTNTAVANVALNPSATPSVQSNSPICLNDILSLTATGGVSYQWTGPNGFFSTAQNPTLVATSMATAGNYSVLVTDANGCQGTNGLTTVINPIPTGNIISSNPKACAPLCVTFTCVASSPSVTIDWIMGEGSQQNNSPVSGACYNTAGVYTITANITDVGGCRNSTTFTVQPYPKPVADFNYAPIKPIEKVDDVNFTDASYGATIATWNWYFMNTAQATSDLQNPVYNYDSQGNYVIALVVKSDKGCVDTVLKSIQVGEDFGIYLPNSFTPNGDGLNDVFYGKGFGIKKFEMQVFDRWGEKVFTSTDLNEAWDGTYQAKGSKKVEEGVYTWRIKLTNAFGKSKELTGHVTLIK